MHPMLASFGFPTPSDNAVWYFLAAIIALVYYRNSTGKHAQRGRWLLLAILALWLFQVGL
jgi:hypothetical protein